MLKDVGDLLTLTLSQAQNREPLSGSTTFNRIDISASSDPLNGSWNSIILFETYVTCITLPGVHTCFCMPTLALFHLRVIWLFCLVFHSCNENALTLLGIYIGAHGLYTSEVIQIKRKFGQWQDDGGTEEHQNIEFYEYIEAVKLTGDPYVPAGQVNTLP